LRTGADLYIDSLYEPNQAVWAHEYEDAAKLCDSLTPGTPEHEHARERLRYCHEQMNSRGYFRDPYNDWDVLWQFGLSWWNDVLPMLDDDERLSVANTRRILAMLDEREEIFEERLADLPDKKQQSYRERYIELRQFLNQAIALDESVSCSL
jgi:hypothetical protein